MAADSDSMRSAAPRPRATPPHRPPSAYKFYLSQDFNSIPALRTRLYVSFRPAKTATLSFRRVTPRLSFPFSRPPSSTLPPSRLVSIATGRTTRNPFLPSNVSFLLSSVFLFSSTRDSFVRGERSRNFRRAEIERDRCYAGCGIIKRFKWKTSRLGIIGNALSRIVLENEGKNEKTKRRGETRSVLDSPELFPRTSVEVIGLCPVVTPTGRGIN